MYHHNHNIRNKGHHHNNNKIGNKSDHSHNHICLKEHHDQNHISYIIIDRVPPAWPMRTNNRGRSMRVSKRMLQQVWLVRRRQ
jgi:hypothetical protein